MALTGWLKIDGIEGGSTHADHKGEIDIHGLHWAMMRARSTETGSGRARSRAMVENLTCRKHTDAASVYLALACLQGRSFPKAVLTLRETGGDAPLDYLVIAMRNCMVTGFDLDNDGSDPDDRVLRETLMLAFEQVTLTHTERNNGHSAGREHEIEYDIVRGV